MDPYDRTAVEQVWQRVHGDRGASAPPEEGLQELIASEWVDATVYLNLSRRMGGKESTLLRQLFQEEQAHVSCLKGIYTLITGRRPLVRASPPAQEPVPQTLRRCYGREMRSLSVYEARSSDPEYGHVFAKMALQEREHCRILLEIIGNLSAGDAV